MFYIKIVFQDVGFQVTISRCSINWLIVIMLDILCSFYTSNILFTERFIEHPVNPIRYQTFHKCIVLYNILIINQKPNICDQ